jgi:hypothetical protein
MLLQQVRQVGHRLLLPGLALLLFSSLIDRASAQSRQVLDVSTLSSGFGIGVNSSGEKTNWLTKEAGDMEMSYPPDQAWGAVFITVGNPKPPPRPSQDFSAFDTLSVEMKGEAGGESLQIGLKTNAQPDNGSETKLPLRLTSEWKTYKFPLRDFTGTDPRRLYVVAEFVFSGAAAETVYFRNVRYSNGSAALTSIAPLARQPVAPSATAQVSIAYPTGHYVVVSPSGKRPSILVRGTGKDVPAGSNVYLIVHPRLNANSWAQPVTTSGQQWVAQAFFGDLAELPGKDDAFDILAAVADHPLPDSQFVLREQTLSALSNVVDVTVETVSWWDRFVAYAKDLELSGPLGASCTALGGIIGVLIDRKLRDHETPDCKTSGVKGGNEDQSSQLQKRVI